MRTRKPVRKKPRKGGGKVVYTPFFRHWRTGKIVRRKNGGVFRFVVR